MKLKAFTLIETLVTMVILGIIFSLTTLLAFNLYKSIPSWHEIRSESACKEVLDSLILQKRFEPLVLESRGISMQYEVAKSKFSDKVFVAYLQVIDSVNVNQIFEGILILEDEN